MSNQFKGFGRDPQSSLSKKDKTLLYKRAMKGDKTSQKFVTSLKNRGDLEILEVQDEQLRKMFDDYAEQAGSTMIKAKDYTPMNCCLCGERMESIHDTHNPEPLTPRTYAKEAELKGSPNRCCSKCNQLIVNPVRSNNISYLNSDARIAVSEEAVERANSFLDFSLLGTEENRKKFKKIQKEVNG